MNIDFFLALYNEYGALIGMASSTGSYENGDFTASLKMTPQLVTDLKHLLLTTYQVITSLGTTCKLQWGVTVDTNATVKIYKSNNLLGEYKIADVINPDSSNKIFFEVGVYNDSIFHPELSYVLTP